jgi:hypothetical protein
VTLGPVGVSVGVAVAEAVGVPCASEVGVSIAATRDKVGAPSTNTWEDSTFALAVKAIAVGR